MSKSINHEQLDETLGMTECTDGFWLYDTTRGMNLSMHAKTKDAAYLEALQYYQHRLLTVELELKSLRHKVSTFVDQFVENDDET